MLDRYSCSEKIPANAGIGLRAPHYRDVLEQQPKIGWFEVHSENYFGDGGAPHHYLTRIRNDYPLSLHGVGLSLGSADALNPGHLEKLKKLIDRYQPGLVSEHVSWGSVDGSYYNDLLPLPYTEECLDHLVQKVVQTQDYLGRQILLENASTYLEFEFSTIPEWEFVSALAERADCHILFDVNNVYVNAQNHGFDPQLFIDTIPVSRVREIHLAGHTRKLLDDNRVILIDTHNDLVIEPVWGLYQQSLQRLGAVPTLMEWDADIPELSVLLDEARHAQGYLDQRQPLFCQHIVVENHAA